MEWKCVGQPKTVKELKEMLAEIPDNYEIKVIGVNGYVLAKGNKVVFDDADYSEEWNSIESYYGGDDDDN